MIDWIFKRRHLRVSYLSESCMLHGLSEKADISVRFFWDC